jgi:LacI family transcriptional regulator
MTTIKDIAERLNVSISTVSKALNGGRDISDNLRQTILDTAVEMGYVNRRSQKTENRKLCIFIENMEYDNPDQFGYDIVLGYRQAASKENWSIDILAIDQNFPIENKYDN